MPDVFEKYAQEYDAWFDRFPFVYQSELQAIKGVLQRVGQAVEIGVGTGRFAPPLNIRLGVEPSPAMAALAHQRGVQIILAKAENLPLLDSLFDTVLMVTVLCFLCQPFLALQEAARILKPGGRLVLGLLDPDSPLGRRLEAEKEQSRFFREAKFVRLPQVLTWLSELDFQNIACCQTIFHELAAIAAPEPVRPGFGAGLFVVVRAQKPTAR